MGHARISAVAATLAAVALLPSCAPQAANGGMAKPSIVLSDSDYQPASPGAIQGAVLPASVKLIPMTAWTSWNLSQFRTQSTVYGPINISKVSGEEFGPLLKANLTAEFSGVFRTVAVSDVLIPEPVAAQDKSVDFIAITAISFGRLAAPPGIMASSNMGLAVGLISRQTKQLVRMYSSKTRVDLPFGTDDSRAEQLRLAINHATQDIGKQVAQDEQLRTGVALGLYQDTSPNLVAGETSPYDQAMNAVVRIEREGSVGSGFLIAPDGLILTALHVVGNAATVTVKLRQGGSFTGSVVSRDDNRDLALVKITKTLPSFTPLALASGPSPIPGTEVVAIGAPEGLSWSVTKADVSAVRQLRVAKVVQVDRALDPGNSGGPLIDAGSGKVIGVMSFNTGNQGFAILAEEVRQAFGALAP